MRIFIVILLCVHSLLAHTLDSLLQEYKQTSDNSLQTVNEKLGHVIIYSQKEIRLMQYHKLNDILKELPMFNVNTNRFGLTSHSLTGSKTTTSGFFRFFINDHEISSTYDQSASLSWGDLPLDFVDHIEIYYGESSFSLGNDTGIYFVRIYTKSATKENGSELNALLSSNGSHSQSFTHSQSFENGWSYLLFFNHDRIIKTTDYNAQTLNANGEKKYFYLDANNERTRVNVGYTDTAKNNYAGLAFDAAPENGEITSKDFFIHYSHLFLEDKSLKTNFSVDINHRKYEEANAQGIALIPVLDFTNLGLTIPKAFYEDLRFVKTNAYVSKSFDTEDNSFLTALNVQNKTYHVSDRETINFANQTNVAGAYNNFDNETTSSLLFQDHYQLSDTLILTANAKFDRYERNGSFQDFSENLFRIGAIYTPFEHFGLKTFYTETALPPSFYTMDYANPSTPDLKSQQYRFYTIEAVFTMGESKFSVDYNHVLIDDFLYLTPIGFINIDHTIKSEGFIFDYEYSFSERDKLHLNYYTSNLSEQINNSTKGGYVKFMGGFDKIDYFASIIYKNAYRYFDVHVPQSFNASLGATYHASKDLSYSIKATNIFDNSTQSLYAQGIGGTNFALDDTDRSVMVSFRWVF